MIDLRKMIKNALFLFVFLTTCFMLSNAYAVTFVWDANTDNPIGYIVYFNEQGDTDTPYNTSPIPHPTNEVTINDARFVPGVTYDCWATAYNGSGESVRSEVIQYTVNPFEPPAENLPVMLDFPSSPSTVRIM